MCSLSINDRGVEEKIQLIILLILQAKVSNCPLLILNGLNIHTHTGTHTHTPTYRNAQNSRREDAPLSAHQVSLHRRTVILGQQWPLREPPSRERRRRKKTHRCIYRKMRPHNTRFGERIIKEPWCAGARVPVFWLTLCKQAGPRMNQRWDAGLTPWHTHRETALLLVHTHLFLTRTLLRLRGGGMGQCFDFLILSAWPGVAETSQEIFTDIFERTYWILGC